MSAAGLLGFRRALREDRQVATPTEAHAAGYEQARQDHDADDVLAMASYREYQGHGLSPELSVYWVLGYEHYLRLRWAGQVFKADRD